MSAGKVTCSTCGKVWQDRGLYLSDRVKCGSPHCPLLIDNAFSPEKPRVDYKAFFKKEERTVITVSKGTIPNKCTLPVQQTYEIEVPKVIVTDMKWE